MYGLCHLSVIPVRKEPSDASEMVTQLLFGEHFQIKGKNKQWRKIRVAWDGYEGWLDEKQILTITLEDFNKLNGAEYFVTVDVVQIADNDGVLFPVLLGSTLPFYAEKNFTLKDKPFSFQGNVKKLNNTAQHNNEEKQLLVENAFMYLNSPYLWGGRSPFGIDCSGFTQMVHKLSGIKLQRDADQQAQQGYTVNLLAQAEAGDLAFFDNEEGKIIHVGIILPENKIIHASGCVRVDKLDYHGIYNVDTKRYSHNLRLIKRFL